MLGQSLLAAAASMFFFSLVPAGAGAVAPPSLPEGFTWVDRAPGDDSATLHRVGTAGAVRDKRLDYAVNAIGCTPDGSVVGLADARRGTHLAGGPHLLRIDAAGAVRDLGAVGPAGSRYPLAQGYAATVENGRLVVASGGTLREVSLGARPAVTRSQDLPSLPYIGDWTLDPGTGELDTLVGAGRHAALVRLAPRTLAATSVPLPGLPGGNGYGGVAWTHGNVLYAVRNDRRGAGAIYRVPLAAPSRARLVRSTGPTESSDAAYCEPQAASVASVPSPSPSPTPTRAPAPAPPLAVASPVHSAAPPVVLQPVVPPPVVPPSVVSPPVVPSRSAVPSPSRRPAVAVLPKVEPATPVQRPQRTVVRSHLAPKRPSVVSKRMIPVVGGAMVAVIVAIRTTRMARASRT